MTDSPTRSPGRRHLAWLLAAISILFAAAAVHAADPEDSDWLVEPLLDLDEAPQALFTYPINDDPAGRTQFITRSTPAAGMELWKVDPGAVAVMVKDIWPGPGSSNPQILGEIAGRTYFTATTAEEGSELWVTDGSSSGTLLLRDIARGPSSSTPSWMGGVAGNLVFAADDRGVSGRELWITDGTASGTVLLKDIVPESTGSNPSRFFATQNIVFFEARDASWYTLWRTDGTPEGTFRIRPDSAPDIRLYQNKAAFGDLAMFLISSATASGLWRSDGTNEGTYRVAPLDHFPFSQEMLVANGYIYFSGRSGFSDRTVWRSDGSSEGTTPIWLLSGIYPPYGDGEPLLSLGGRLLIRGRSDLIWSIEDFQGAPVPLDVQIDRNTASRKVGELLYFSRYTAAEGRELWRTDGTVEGTWLVRDINPGAAYSSPHDFGEVSGRLIFTATNSDGSLTQWVTNEAGTDIEPPPRPNVGVPASASNASSFPTNLIDLNGLLIFNASSTGQPRRIWTSRGTVGTTRPVSDPLGASVSSQSSFVIAGDSAYFVSRGSSSVDLIGTISEDGSATMIPASTLHSPSILGEANGSIYFKARSPGGGVALYRMESKIADPILVADHSTRLPTWDITGLCEFGGLTYFVVRGVPWIRASANAGIVLQWLPSHLWVTDGSLVGTRFVSVMMDDPPSGSAGKIVVWWQTGRSWVHSGLRGIQERIVFSTLRTTEYVADGNFVAGTETETSLRSYEPSTGLSTYLSNMGSNFGFHPVVPDQAATINLIFSDAKYSSLQSANWDTGQITNLLHTPESGIGTAPGSRAVANSHLYFVGNNGRVGSELWKTDATTTGTLLVKDIWPGIGSSSPGQMVAHGNTLFFSADDGTNGMELWKSDGTTTGTVRLADSILGSPGWMGEIAVSGDYLYYVANNSDGTAPDNGSELYALRLTDILDPEPPRPTLMLHGSGLGTVTILADFAKEVRVLREHEVVVANGLVSGLVDLGHGRFQIEVAVDGGDVVEVHIPANVVRDAAANRNIASNVLIITASSEPLTGWLTR